jgi:hypothetical protein
MRKILILLSLCLFCRLSNAQNYVINCSESYLDYPSGEEIALYDKTQPTRAKWKSFQFSDNSNQNKIKQSKLDPELIYHFSIRGTAQATVPVTQGLNAINSGLFTFQTLFSQWPAQAPALVGNTRVIGLHSGAEQISNTAAEESQSHVLGFESTTPAGLILTNNSDLGIVTHQKSGCMSPAVGFGSEYPPISALNWRIDGRGRFVSRTVHVFQPLGATNWLKIVCDKSEAQ